MINIPEIVKSDFGLWYLEQDYNILYDRLEYLHFDFQSGVYKAYLRSVGIEANASKEYLTIGEHHNSTCKGYFATLCFNERKDNLHYKKGNQTNFIHFEFNEAEQAAIQAGLNLREQQLSLTCTQ